MYSEPEPLARTAPVVPAELQRIIRKALAKDADERYQSAKDLALDLHDLLRELGSPRKGVTFAGRRNSTTLAFVALALFVAAAAATIIYFVGRAPRNTPQ